MGARSLRRPVTLLVLAGALVALGLSATGGDPWRAPPVAVRAQPAVPPFDAAEMNEAREDRPPVSHRPAVQAAFAAESYRPGSVAKLVFFDRARRVSLQFYVVGAGTGKWGDGILLASDVMRGTPVGLDRRIGTVRFGTTVRVRVGGWPSGLYFAELTASGGRVGYAPFVLAPPRLGGHRIAVVMPTQTWQAYNYRDDNRDGIGDTWYAGHGQTTARLYRPFEDRGVPAHYKYYDEPFLRWLVHERIPVDVLSDAELRQTSGAALARAYQLIVFPGHHEYVTRHEFDAVTRYRDLGGDLIFLSANNFYSKVTIRDGVMTRVGWYRYLHQPESALVGVQFYHNDLGEHRGPWTIRPTDAGRRIFSGTGLVPGDQLVSGGIEADEVTTASPPHLRVLAEIVNLFGDGRNAQMTYYETAQGAKVFAAGAFTLACSSWEPHVSRLIENLLLQMVDD
jgi:hypothetical protein